MGSRETLEAALAAAWDADTLAVYADYLQTEGDPRGELIQLDLQIAATGNTLELSKRRTSLLFAWLGGLVPLDDVHASWVGDSLRFGFVETLEVDGARANAVARLAQALASPAGQYVRALDMRGSAADLEAALAIIAGHEHRWLTKLAIGGAPVSPAVAEAAFAAMPNLTTLVLRSPAFSALSHARIETLTVHGREAYAALVGFEAVRTLELDLGRSYYDEDYDFVAEERDEEPALPPVAFPSLRRLAIEASFAEVVQFLRTFDARAHVTTLRIPHLRSASERNDLIGAIRDMHALETIEIAQGGYYDPPDLPNVTLVRAEVWPWPDRGHAIQLRVFMPGAKYGDTIDAGDAVPVMEQRYETLPPVAREAWSRFWRALPPKRGRVEFPARVLAEAVEAIPTLMQNGWRELREELQARRPLGPGAMVAIERATS